MLNEYDIVALTEEIQATHKETHQTILLRKGQVGTILMSFENTAYLIDFADNPQGVALFQLQNSKHGLLKLNAAMILDHLPLL